MSKYLDLVQEAKEILMKVERDEAHNLEHHERVWANCKKIIGDENLDIRQDLLEVAAFWHDVVVGEVKWPSVLMLEETCTVLEKSLIKLQFTKKEQQTIIESIRFHEFRSQPRSIEGLVLQDADKLDTLCEQRWQTTLGAFHTGKMSREKMTSYATTFLKWLPILSATFHFAHSKNEAENVIVNFWSNDQWRELTNDLGLAYEYQTSRKNMNSIKTKLFRLILESKNFFLKMKISIGSVR